MAKTKIKTPAQKKQLEVFSEKKVRVKGFRLYLRLSSEEWEKLNRLLGEQYEEGREARLKTLWEPDDDRPGPDTMIDFDFVSEGD